MLPVSRCATLLAALLAATVTLANAQRPAAQAIAADSSLWLFEGAAQIDTMLGRRCVRVDGGQATVKGLDLRDAIVDMDVTTPSPRGFFGLLFRGDSTNAEYVYLRQHKSGRSDAMQYTPVLNTGLNWQLYSGPGFTGPVDIPRNEWFHLRLEFAGAQGKLFVKDMNAPALVMTDLKSGVQRGSVSLAVLTGTTCFADIRVQPLPDSPWMRHLPPMAAGALTSWLISPSLDALERNLERPLTAEQVAAMKWEKVEAEPPGLVPLNRYRESPHPRVTFQRDFSTRLDPQPGKRVVFARTEINSDRDQVKKLMLGYSDEVVVYLNGRVLYGGRSAQSFRDPEFLGIMDSEDDSVFLPLRKGRNELVLAISELGGGWGFIARLVELAPR